MRFEYRVGDEEIALDSDDDFVAVRFRTDSTRSQRAAVAKAASVRFADRVDLLADRMAVLPVPPSAEPRGARRAATENTFSRGGAIERVAPVFRVWGGHAVAAQRVLLRLRDPSDPGRWLLEGFNGRSLHNAAHSPKELGERDLILGPDDDPLLVTQELAGHPKLHYAEPSFINMLDQQRPKRSSASASSSAVGGGSENERVLDLIRAVEAHQKQPGLEKVRIAVLDDGVDTRHEDLPPPVAQYDATDHDEYQEPNRWDGHGTACAGLAVAHANGRGARGVGARCSLMPVRIARTRWSGATWETTNEICAEGIYWAVANGAWILSMSWGGGAPSNCISGAISYAVKTGRGGRGCVVVVAAGNEERRVNYPANHPDVVTVGASNLADEPKTVRSSDGETGWGSNYGPEVDLVAPGVSLRTTDIMGDGGMELSGNYVDNFNGTSGATPLVAGAVGLMLSANPDLTANEVRDILRDTADKVGSVRYVDGRNDRMGHGRLNVAEAVLAAIDKATNV